MEPGFGIERKVTIGHNRSNTPISQITQSTFDERLPHSFALMLVTHRNRRQKVNPNRYIKTKSREENRADKHLFFTRPKTNDLFVIDFRGQIRGKLSNPFAFFLSFRRGEYRPKQMLQTFLV